jgi:hypothetical protein
MAARSGASANSFQSAYRFEASGSLGSSTGVEELLLAREDVDRIAGRLAHLAPVRARHHGHVLQDQRVGDAEHLAVGQVELHGDVARHLDVLLLVLADGNQVGVVNHDVGRLEHWVAEQAGVGRKALRDLVLVGVAALEQAHRRERREDPGQLGHLGQVALAVEDRPLRVQAEGQVVEHQRPHHVAAQLGVADGGHGVVVGDEDGGRVVLLERDVLARGPEVVADVQPARAGGLHARQDPLAPGQLSQGAASSGARSPGRHPR